MASRKVPLLGWVLYLLYIQKVLVAKENGYVWVLVLEGGIRIKVRIPRPAREVDSTVLVAMVA